MLFWILTFIIVVLAFVIWKNCEIKENLTVVPWTKTLECLNLNEEQTKQLFDTIFSNLKNKKISNEVFAFLQKEGYDKDKIMNCMVEQDEIKEDFYNRYHKF